MSGQREAGDFAAEDEKSLRLAGMRREKDEIHREDKTKERC
jgi:hypothetical protein